jgi:hypothetical protein
MAGTTEERCWLCERTLGLRVEYHHPVPKSRGGRTTVPVHPICHRTLHRTFDNKQLARFGEDASAVREAPELSAFLRWIANKPPNFHAPTSRRR